MGTPTCSSGAATMKMIKSTSITSTMGVTLISLMGAWRRDRRRRPAACGVALMLAPMLFYTLANSQIFKAQVLTSICRETMAANSSANASRRWLICCESAEYLL